MADGIKQINGEYAPWEGLWRNNNCFMSKAFSFQKLAEIKGNARILVRENKYFNDDIKRPEYQFAICMAKENKKAPELFWVESETRQVVPLDEAIEICNSLLEDFRSGYSMDDLVVESERFLRAKSFPTTRWR